MARSSAFFFLFFFFFFNFIIREWKPHPIGGIRDLTERTMVTHFRAKWGKGYDFEAVIACEVLLLEGIGPSHSELLKILFAVRSVF